MAKDTTQIKQKFAPKDKMMTCHRCNVSKIRADWGRLTTVEHFAIEDMPRHGRKRMICKECVKASFPKREQEDTK